MSTNRLKWGLGALLVVVGVAACDDLLTVSDPQRYTTEDLDGALPAVANGVEGAVHEVIDSWVIYQELLSDTYEHTGTWQGYDEVDHGRFQYATSAMDGTNNSLLRARWFAGAAEERFERVIGSGYASDPLTAQVRLGGAMADLYIGLAFCEAPAVSDGPAVSRAEILQQAVAKFTSTIESANAAGATAIATAATAGRARANLILGNYAAAASDAAQVPDGFSYDAKFNNQSGNSIVVLTTATFNEAAGLRNKWWSRVPDDANGPTSMRDPYSGQLDSRIAVHWDGDRATDNITPHYSQWKYNGETDDIPMVHADEMRLIQAEAAMRNGDYAAAMGFINALRAKVGLDPIATPATETAMRDILLSERFAELYMEGMRAVDLERFGLNKAVFAAMNDPERPATGRPTLFSMSNTEALYNNNIADDLAQRCLPKTN